MIITKNIRDIKLYSEEQKMGRMSELDIENQEAEMELDLDNQNHTDGAWWKPLDTEMVQAEQEQMELDAEIFELRTGGWL